MKLMKTGGGGNGYITSLLGTRLVEYKIFFYNIFLYEANEDEEN